MRITELVKTTCEEVAKNSKHVHIDEEKLDLLIEKYFKEKSFSEFFDCEGHISKDSPLEDIITYIFVIDAINFCFWPAAQWEYADLCQSVSDAYKDNKNCLKASYLSSLSLDTFRKEFLSLLGDNIPLLEERYRAVKEIGTVVQDRYNGKFSEILVRSDFEAEKVLETVAREFLMFQDHSIYQGKQVFFYKRAQILVGDLFAALRQKADPEAQIRGVEALTCFADYRVPQILNQEGVLAYSEELMIKINNKKELAHGSQEEVEIRAGMIQAVELLKQKLEQKGETWLSIEVDWTLWQIGEERRKEIVPHHRVLSIFY